MQTLSRSSVGLALALVAAFAPSPGEVSAQECAAEVTPASIQAGQRAVRLTVALSQDVGEVSGLATENSGIVVAEARDLPRTELAADRTQPQPIAMGAGPNTWTVWVNTLAARPGSHEIAFVAGERRCAGEVAIARGN